MKNYFIISLIIVLLIFNGCGSNKKYENMPAQLAELSKQIDKNPKKGDLYQLRAEYYYRNHQVDDALADILHAIKLDGNKSSYYVTLSDVYFAKKETDLVEEMLQKAIAIDNNNEAYLKLAELYLILRMYTQCNETLDNALRLKNHNPKVHLTRAFLLKDQGDETGYVRMLQLCIDQDPKEIIAFTELADFFGEKLNPVAVSYFKNALEVNPNDKILIYKLGKLYQDLGELDAAKEQYQTLLSIDPESYPAYNNLGYIALVYEDKYQEAIRFFTKAIEINPSYAQGWCNRGLAYQYLKDYDKARSDYMQSKKIDPDYKNAIDLLNDLDKIRK